MEWNKPLSFTEVLWVLSLTAVLIWLESQGWLAGTALYFFIVVLPIGYGIRLLMALYPLFKL